jgi:Undecaprenyl-phosphate glucose phosphotransferase
MKVRRHTGSWSTESKTRRLPISSQVVPGLFFVLDTIVILLCAAITHAILVGHQPVTEEYYLVATSFVWLVTVMLFAFSSLYQFEAIMHPLAFADRLLIVFATTFLFLLAAAFSLKISDTFSRLWIGTFAISSCLGILGARTVASIALNRLADRAMFCRRVAIAGYGPQVRQLLDFLEKSNPAFISIVGIFIDEDDSKTAKGELTRFPRLGQVDDVVRYARGNDIDDIIIAMPWSEDERLNELVSRLRTLAANVYLGADLVGYQVNFRAPPSHFGGVPIFEILDHPLAGWNGVLKSIQDYVLGVVALILFSPLMAIIALAIKLESPGPVIFSQQRLGFLNRPFYIYKFRTMKDEPSPGITQQATRDDPRVTRVGHFLRRTSLDELPNLVNVLNGTMSLVGPRPHALDHNQTFSKMISDYFIRHRIKPGMTGWAQVNGMRGETDTPDKIEGRVQYDIYYAENWSLGLDIKILMMTVAICLTGRNAY